MSEIKISTPFDDAVVAEMVAGQRVLLSGVIYTARDAAHKRLCGYIDRCEQLPVDLNGQVIYFVGPSPARPGHPIGSAGPTTSYRMDAYSPSLIAYAGLKGMIGKGARDISVINAMKKHKCVYFAATGGAAALIAKCIISAEVILFNDLGAEAIHRLVVKDLPLIVATDSFGCDLYSTARTIVP
jgi:fumarate hydratase subunit beta